MEDKTEVIPKFAVDIIKEIINIGKAHNKQILLENQSTCYVSTFDSIIDIIEQINDEKFKLNWDPYNSFQIDKRTLWL
ncbi:MAG: TIM barrel protein [Eubacterium ventriosum]